ncbi:MAG: hypothetical protein QOJ49_564 [Actinomycetota bacterium]|jgi:hypothetical protein|nr:hypothetical protein [Actinomycetota bacterium]MDQ1625066.1 hypothetical protein [Actinomycetota bacterium]
MARRGKKGSGADGQADETPKKQGRISQIRQAYTMTRQVDRKVGWVTLGFGLLPVVLLVVVGLLIGHPIYLGIIGAMLGFLAASFVFGRRAERAAYLQVEGQPGAAAAALNLLRRGWTITPGVAVTSRQDIVHRAVGKPGVVLIGEGPPTRVGNLLAAEKKKVARYLPEVPVYDIQAGNDTGQIPLRKLNAHLMKLPRNLNSTQISEVNRRLRALGGVNLPIPKGPMPKNIRMPRGPRG